MTNLRSTPSTPQYGGASKFGMSHGGLNTYWSIVMIGAAIGFAGAFARMPALALGGLGLAVAWGIGSMVLYFKLRCLILVLAIVAWWISILYAVINFVIL